MPYLTEPERAELEQILMATPEPVTVVRTIIGPDRTVQGHLLQGPGGYRPLDAAEASAMGLRPASDDFCETIP